MVYEALGRVHASLLRLGSDRGQGTVEYVALILLVAVVLAGVVAATKGSKIGTEGIAETIIKKLKGALEGVK